MKTAMQQPSVSPDSPAPTPTQVLFETYDALTEKGYNPTQQIVGYLLTEDPTYITNYNRARALIARVDRDELLSEIVQYYFAHAREEKSAPADKEAQH